MCSLFQFVQSVLDWLFDPNYKFNTIAKGALNCYDGSNEVTICVLVTDTTAAESCEVYISAIHRYMMTNSEEYTLSVQANMGILRDSDRLIYRRNNAADSLIIDVCKCSRGKLLPRFCGNVIYVDEATRKHANFELDVMPARYCGTSVRDY